MQYGRNLGVIKVKTTANVITELLFSSWSTEAGVYTYVSETRNVAPFAETQNASKLCYKP